MTKKTYPLAGGDYVRDDRAARGLRQTEKPTAPSPGKAARNTTAAEHKPAQPAAAAPQQRKP